LRVQEEDKEEQDKIQNSKTHCTGQHQRDQVAPGDNQAQGRQARGK
jgi:hypothetical protein